MGIWNQFGEYLFIKKKDPNQERTKWMKYMHGMNRLSLIMFIIGLLVILYKWIIKPLFN